jgi:hypothetical protein
MAGTRTRQTNDEPKTDEATPDAGPTDLGKNPYQGEPAEKVKDDRPAEQQPGTPEHLGDSPYAGTPA